MFRNPLRAEWTFFSQIVSAQCSQKVIAKYWKSDCIVQVWGTFSCESPQWFSCNLKRSHWFRCNIKRWHKKLQLVPPRSNPRQSLWTVLNHVVLYLLITTNIQLPRGHNVNWHCTTRRNLSNCGHAGVWWNHSDWTEMENSRVEGKSCRRTMQDVTQSQW